MDTLGGDTHRRRQYLKDLMSRELTRYQEGCGDLARLVSDVESLISSLSEVEDEAWVEAARTAWWELEVPLATSLDEERPPTLRELDAVNAAVRSIELLLRGEFTE